MSIQSPKRIFFERLERAQRLAAEGSWLDAARECREATEAAQEELQWALGEHTPQ